MQYRREIISVLTEAGEEGLSVRKIAYHVFNACNSLFCAVSYDEIYRSVATYLASNSKIPESVIMRTDRRGIYRLNLESKETQQLMIQFQFADESVVDPFIDHTSSEEDLSLSLF